MVTGNFALLAGVDPAAVHEWYLSVYVDAFEWVEAPNTLGMSQFADGGVLGSKPYVSSGAYIDRMSDHCGGCSYRVKEKVGRAGLSVQPALLALSGAAPGAVPGEPADGADVPGLGRGWTAGHREAVLAGAEGVLGRLDAGEVV